MSVFRPTTTSSTQYCTWYIASTSTMRDSPKLAPQERASFSTEDGTEIASRPFLHQPRPVHATVLPDDADAETDAEAEPGIGAAHLPGDFAGPSSPSPRPRSALSPAPLIAPRYTVPSSSAVPTSTATPPPRTSLRSPPLAHRNAGPLPTSSDLETWEAHCRALYFEQSDVAARAIENTLSSCPPAHRATYTRAQSRIRAAYHAAMAQERRDALARLISSTAPHSSLTPGARLNVHGRMARHERRILWNDFVREHCKRGNIGPHPFFAALLLLLEVQARGQAQGGAGAARVEWELDDAVLMEVGGDTFMRAAVAALKGVSVIR